MSKKRELLHKYVVRAPESFAKLTPEVNSGRRFFMRIQILFLAIIAGFFLTGCGAGVSAQKNVPPPFGIDKRPLPTGAGESSVAC